MTDDEYSVALIRIDELFDNVEPGPELDELLRLVNLVEAHEALSWPQEDEHADKETK